MNKVKTKIEPLIHITKRTDMPSWKQWIIRGVAIVVAFLVSGIVSAILTKGEFGGFFENVFLGAFGTERRVLNLFQAWAMLLIIGIALVPAFKMKFWNIGAEGQILMGCLVSAGSRVCICKV